MITAVLWTAEWIQSRQWISLSVPDYTHKCNARIELILSTQKMAFHMHQRAVSSGNILFAQMIESCLLNDEWGSAGSYGLCPGWIVSKDHVWMMTVTLRVILMQYLTSCCISAKSRVLNIYCIYTSVLISISINNFHFWHSLSNLYEI